VRWLAFATQLIRLFKPLAAGGRIRRMLGKPQVCLKPSEDDAFVKDGTFAVPFKRILSEASIYAV
jgi:hypothetical protein